MSFCGNCLHTYSNSPLPPPPPHHHHHAPPWLHPCLLFCWEDVLFHTDYHLILILPLQFNPCFLSTQKKLNSIFPPKPCLMTMHVLDTNITANVFRLTMYGHSSIDSTAAVVRRGLCCFSFTIMVDRVTTYNIWGNRGIFAQVYISPAESGTVWWSLYQTHCCKHIQNVASYPGPAQLFVTSVLQVMESWARPGYKDKKCIF